MTDGDLDQEERGVLAPSTKDEQSMDLEKQAVEPSPSESKPSDSGSVEASMEDPGLAVSTDVIPSKNSDSQDEDRPPSPPPPPTELQMYYGWFMSDVLLYLTVLNLAAEFVKGIVVKSFLASIASAVILKVVLDIVVTFAGYIYKTLFVERKLRVLAGLMLWGTVLGARFLILWIDQAIFVKTIDLGSFWSILILSAVLMVVSRGSRLIYDMLATDCCLNTPLLFFSKSETYMNYVFVSVERVFLH